MGHTRPKRKGAQELTRQHRVRLRISRGLESRLESLLRAHGAGESHRGVQDREEEGRDYRSCEPGHNV